MQTAGPVLKAVAAAEATGWLERNNAENTNGTLRFTVTVIVVAAGGALPDGPKDTASVSVAVEKPLSSASLLATVVMVDVVWLESDSSRPALSAVTSAIV
jgi:hypothetical protein